jgi:OmpR family response regulator RpaB
MKKILIVDDEKPLARVMSLKLNSAGYQTMVVFDGEQAIEKFNTYHPDIVILDIMLPKVDGFVVCKEIRSYSEVPVIIVSAVTDVAERIKGLEMGADDYVTKPFSPNELEARIRAVLRRVTDRPMEQNVGHSNNVVVVGNLKIDTSKRQVYKNNERIRLTGMEFNLLELLVSNSGKPFSRADILQQVWAYPADHRIDTRVVDVHISRLRSKLEEDPANPELILTSRGTGYMFQKI